MTEKYVKGRKSGVATDENKITRGGTIKTIPGGHESESGSKHGDLCSAAHSIYQKAVKNDDKSRIGDQALRDR